MYRILLWTEVRLDPPNRQPDSGVLQAWNKALAEDEQVWDQNAFNDLFRQHIEVNSPSAKLRTFM